jgi:hypothetical protein
VQRSVSRVAPDCVRQAKIEAIQAAFLIASSCLVEYCGYNDNELSIAGFIVSGFALDSGAFHPVCTQQTTRFNAALQPRFFSSVCWS